MHAKVRNAFVAVHDGYSPDRVVADPELNQQFIAECRRIGLQESAEDLNRRLLNARKARHLAGVRTTKETSFADEDDYAWACEIAERHLERRHNVTLDQIICRRELAEEFDELAARLAPGHTPLQYRWAALNLRKKRDLAPEPIAQAIPSEKVEFVAVPLLDADSIPPSQGLYVLVDRAERQALYIGECENLRRRLGKHLEHSDKKELARWLWERGIHDILIEYHVLAPDTPSRTRRALEAELIRSRNPLFNIRR